MAISCVLWEGGQPAAVPNPQVRHRTKPKVPSLDLRQMGNHSLIQPLQIPSHTRHVLVTEETQTQTPILVGFTS